MKGNALNTRSHTRPLGHTPTGLTQGTPLLERGAQSVLWGTCPGTAEHHDTPPTRGLSLGWDGLPGPEFSRHSSQLHLLTEGLPIPTATGRPRHNFSTLQTLGQTLPRVPAEDWAPQECVARGLPAHRPRRLTSESSVHDGKEGGQATGTPGELF